jgi:hypothetical protein
MMVTAEGQTRELPLEVGRVLAAKAHRAGVAAADYIVRVLAEDAHAEKETPATPVVFSHDRQTRNAQIRALLHAPSEVRAATLEAGMKALAADYVNNVELTEFTSALQNEDFCDAD